MRAAILSVALWIACPLSSLAETLKPIDCGARQGCQRAFLVDGFHSLHARPVALSGNRIALLGLDGLEEDAALWRLDPSMADGSVKGAIEMEIDGQELAMVRAMLRGGFSVRAELSPDGGVVAVFLQQTQSHVLRFFGASGKPMGLVGPPYDTPWPPSRDLEWTPVDLLSRFAGMNALRFEDTGLRLGYAGLSVIADYQTGEVTVSGTASDANGDLAGLLDPAFDPVGFESYWFGAGIAAATNDPADGVPAQLALLQGGQAFVPYAMPPGRDRGDRVLDPNAAGDLVLTFAEPILTPDAMRLAVLRRDATGTVLQVFDTASGAVTWSSEVPSDPAMSSTLVWAESGELVHVLQSGAGTELYVYRAVP
ncbi:MAG: hypothetical protein MUE83_04290 [Tabrizicola sp.]|jgi:hypothetical protein|nr:hypothetical protein [Tabrizicola sp.]